jgi:hypothetical protein
MTAVMLLATYYLVADCGCNIVLVGGTLRGDVSKRVFNIDCRKLVHHTGHAVVVRRLRFPIALLGRQPVWLRRESPCVGIR